MHNPEDSGTEIARREFSITGTVGTAAVALTGCVGPGQKTAVEAMPHQPLMAKVSFSVNDGEI